MLNRNLIRLLLVLPAAASAWTPTRATHVAAAELLYHCTGNPNEFEITLNLYRDCIGSELDATQDIQINNPCGGPQTLTLTQTLVQEVSQLCATELVNSTCNGGSQPGIEMHQYKATVTLPPCDHIIFSWTLCCRNGAIDNIYVSTADTDMYIETTMYSGTFPCDDSPVFNSSPVPYLCQNYPVTYGFGTTEVNGDNLVYTFVEALEAPGLPCVYNAPYASTNPIDGISLDPATGTLTFTPTTQGNFVVTVLVSQYDDDGVLIGTVMRDMQFVVIPCSNVPPDPSTGVVVELTQGDTLSAYGVNACGLSSFCYNLTIVDPDTSQAVTLETNVLTAMPGSTFSYTGTNPVTAHVCWSIPADFDQEYATFQILATDDACPITAFSSYVYTIQICPPAVVEIPNVFSPNNDGPNDAFYFIKFTGFATFKMEIFNRWGQMIHETSAKREDKLIWAPNDAVTEGTYYYRFTGITITDAKEVERHGYFTLLR